MKEVLNVVSDFIIVVDKYGKIQFCNDKMLSKLAYKESDLINLDIKYILSTNNNDLNGTISKINIDDKLNIKVSITNKENELLDLCGDMFINSFNDKEAIYMILKEVNNKTYNIDDLETLLDSLPIDTWIKGLDGKYIFTNTQYANRMNCNKEDMIGKENEIYWGKENKNKDFLNIEDEIIKTKIPKICEINVKHNNKDKHFEMYKAPILDNNGNVKYTIGSIRDITLKKVIKKGMYENNKRLDLFNSNISIEKDMDELLDNIALNIVDSFEADALGIFLYDEESSYLNLCKTQGYMDLLCKDKGLNSFYIDDTLKKDLLTEDIKNLHNRHIDSRKSSICEKLNIKIEYSESYKLVIDNEFIGIISVGYLEGNKPRFDRDVFLNTSCKEIAMIIKNYRLSNELKKELYKRQQAEKDLEVFLDISVDTMAIINNIGECIFVSPTINEILYWNEKELLNKSVIDIVHPNDKTEIINIFKRKSTNTVRKQHRFLCKKAEYKWLEWNYRYIIDKDCYVITARDITKEKKEEDQRKALESAVQLESLKNEFFANISHEFKTPINIILGTMQLLDKYVTPENIIMKNEIDLNRYINSTKQNSYRLLKLVNNLLDMTRIDTGFYELQLGNYNIINIIESITLSVAQYIENKGIKLIFDTNEEESLLACDPDKIERIVLNILSNSIKYTDSGGEIFVKVDVNIDKVRISIKDTGLGISKEKLPFIFDRFKQGDNLLTRNSEGSGIGLSLVKSLVEMHEGKIYVVSEEKKGTEFTFELPIRVVDSNRDIQEDLYEEFKIEKCNIEFSDIYSI